MSLYILFFLEGDLACLTRPQSQLSGALFNGFKVFYVYRSLGMIADKAMQITRAVSCLFPCFLLSRTAHMPRQHLRMGTARCRSSLDRYFGGSFSGLWERLFGSFFSQSRGFIQLFRAKKKKFIFLLLWDTACMYYFVNSFVLFLSFKKM